MPHSLVKLLFGASRQHDESWMRWIACLPLIGAGMMAFRQPFHIFFQDYMRIGPASPERGDPSTPGKGACPFPFWHLRSFPRGEFPLHHKGRDTEIDVRVEGLSMQRGNQLPIAHL